ncbi:BnaC05g26370D [Brassica napus]|uniref:BnaC05g26370D protein n=1 Tax=Brassica napus TaxID=3708 RepID=A0A078G2W7_BRANA|nr:BnaC05g26370D [Brassica napus]
MGLIQEVSIHCFSSAESKRSENVDSEEDDFNYPDKVYYDLKEAQKQADLWHEAEKKHPWHNASPKIKVTHENGFYHMNIELTVGLPPYFLYNFLIDPGSGAFRDLRKRRNLMENKSRKVLFENGPRQMMRMEKSVACNVFGVYIPISMNLIVDENRKDLMVKRASLTRNNHFSFEGNYKVEPIFVDKERLCKKRIPMTREEYKKCSGGQGKVASKLTIDQYYQPYSPFNLPPLSWFIRGMTVKTSKSLLAQVQDTSIAVRTATPMPKETTSNKDEKH